MRGVKSAVAGVGLMFVGGAAIAAPNAEDYVGAWLTTYTCGNFNAVAYLRLSADPAGGSLTGSYAYHPAGRSQPNRVGHFEVTAKVFPSGVIRMTPGKWLKRPRGYGAAPIHGNLSADGSRIVGTIQGAQCDQLVFARSTGSLGPLARQLPGTWRGRFTCADRDFRATLEVDHLAGLPALDIATFSYRPRDPSVPSPAARYEIELSRSAAGVRGTVVKPLMITSNAELYGLDADPSDAGDTLSVRLSDADCSALAMTQPPPPGSLRIVTAQAPMTQLLRKDRVDTLTIADTRTACSLIAEWHRDFRTRFDMGTASLQDIQVRTSYPVYPLMLLAEAFTPYYGRAYDSLRSTPELGDHLANLVPQCRRLAPARDIPSSEFFQVLFGSAWKDRPRVGLRYDRDQLLFDVEQAKAALAWRDDQLARMDARTQLLDPDEIADVRARAETRMVRLSPDLRAPLLMALDSQRAVHVERMETTFAGGADSAETAAAVLTTRQSSLSIAELKALAALLGDTDREIYPDAHRALESRIRRTLKEIRVSKAYNDLSLEARADYLRDTLGRLIDDGDLADQVAEVEVAPELARQRAAQRTRAAAAREQVLATERAQLTSAVRISRITTGLFR